MSNTRPMCRHCGKKYVNRPRGTCWVCYYTPGVKELYPPTSKFARRGVPNYYGPRPLPAEPTRTEPGSPERVAVLAERAAAGVSLWHPEDVGVYVRVPEWSPPVCAVTDRVIFVGVLPGDCAPPGIADPGQGPRRGRKRGGRHHRRKATASRDTASALSARWTGSL